MKSADLYEVERWAFGEAKKAYVSNSPEMYLRYMQVAEAMKNLREFDSEKSKGYSGGTT